MDVFDYMVAVMLGMYLDVRLTDAARVFPRLDRFRPRAEAARGNGDLTLPLPARPRTGAKASRAFLFMLVILGIGRLMIGQFEVTNSVQSM